MEEEELRRQRVDRLFAAADRLCSLPSPPLTEEEVEAEIQAVRARRARSRSTGPTGRENGVQG